MKFIDLTHPMRHGQPSFPGDPVLAIAAHSTIEKQRCKRQPASMGSHQGTHLDALYHFVPDGLRLDKCRSTGLRPGHGGANSENGARGITVADFKPFEAKLAPGARIIYETAGIGSMPAKYFTDFPSLTQAAATYLAGRGIACWVWTRRRRAAITTRSTTSSSESRRKSSSSSRCESRPTARRFPFIGFPLRLENGDGSPIRAVAGCG